MKLNFFRFTVRDLFNFAISNSVIVILAGLLLLNIDWVQRQVEASMMETDVANIRWGLREMWAHRNASGQALDIGAIEDSNPLRLINEPPKNYSGEHDRMPAGAASVWYFDTKARRLVYVFRDGRQARFRLTGTAGLKRASLGAVGGLDLISE